MPKIVHILYSGVGGQAGVVFPLIRASHGRAEHLCVFYGIEAMADDNISQCSELGVPWRSWIKKPGLDRGQQKEIAAWIIEQKADVVIAHNLALLPAAISARRALPNMRVIAVEHHCNALKSAKRWMLSVLALWSADAVVYLSEKYREEVAGKLKFLYRHRKTRVIPNGLNLGLYPQAAPPMARPFVVGMQGRMVEGKDFPTLIRAAAIARAAGHDIVVEIAGNGPRMTEIQHLIEELKMQDHVRLKGLLSHRDLIETLRHWHAYAHCSDGETMSVAIMEAKALGLPILASDAPGVSLYFKDGMDGLLFAPRDAEALAALLIELARDEARRRALAKASRLSAQDFSAERSWQAYESLFLAPLLVAPSPPMNFNSSNQWPSKHCSITP